MWRELVRFGRHVIAAGIVQRVGEQADRVLVGRFVGTASLGQYQYALRLAMAPFEATLAVASHVLFPAFARISHDRERLNSAFLRSLRWVMVVAMPASLILFPLGEPLAVVLFGEVWRPAGTGADGDVPVRGRQLAAVDLPRGREGVRQARGPGAGPPLHDADHGGGDGRAAAAGARRRRGRPVGRRRRGRRSTPRSRSPGSCRCPLEEDLGRGLGTRPPRRC